MNPFLTTLLISFLVCEIACIGALQIGDRVTRSSPWLQRIGTRAHRRRIQALKSVWPLTLLPRAIEKRNQALATGILTTLILLKSAMALPLGLAFLPWLPFASLVVPAILAAHDPSNDKGIRRWALNVARFQVTSHAAAAAVGFAVTIHGPLAGRPLTDLLASNELAVGGLLILSVLSALGAGRAEAKGVVFQGYLLPEKY